MPDRTRAPAAPPPRPASPAAEVPRPAADRPHVSTMGCAPGPFERLSYFHGQMLGSDDLRTEQRYFIEKQKLHNRCLHGWGVVCGLLVREPACESDATERLGALLDRRDALEARLERMLEAGEAAGADEIREAIAALDEQIAAAEDLEAACDDAVAPHFELGSGLALDCEGNEILVPRDCRYSLWSLLDERDRHVFADGSHTVWISIRFVDLPTHPVRPVLPDGCGVPRSRAHGRWRDHYRIVASLEAPKADERCETCCDGCCCDDVLLARLDRVRRGRPLEATRIHNEARRMLTRYEPTRITGISWTHGADYSRSELEAMIADGLVLEFSRPVQAQTVRRGVVDLWVVDGGKGRNGNIWRMEVKYLDLPASGSVERIRFHNDSGEVLNPGDRLIIQFRGEFVLDHCCQPVAGVHVGGRVPLLADFERWRRTVPGADLCPVPPEHPGPWTSGSELVRGSRFESWVFLADPHNSENPR